MAKKTYKINNFEGGINKKSDARDIDDNQLASAFNVNVSDTGRIRIVGDALSNWSTVNDYNQLSKLVNGNLVYYKQALNPTIENGLANGKNLTNGYGLFTCSHDYTSNGMTAADTSPYDIPQPQKSEFILINDGAHIDLWDSSFNNAGEKGIPRWIQRAITLGSAHGGDTFKEKVKPTYYKSEGGIRVCDGNFDLVGPALSLNVALTTNYYRVAVDTGSPSGGGFSHNSDIDDGTYIKINDEIMKVVNTLQKSGTETWLNVLRGQFHTKIVVHPVDSDIYKINVPKILTHVNRSMLKNAYILSSSVKTSLNHTVNTWVEDIQCLEPPGEAKALAQYRAVPPSGDVTYVATTTVNGIVHRGRGLAVFDGPVTAMAKRYHTNDASSPVSAQENMGLYPNDKEKVLLSLHQSNSASDSEFDLSQYDSAGGVGDIPTVEITSAAGINWAQQGFVKGKQVIISGTTEINGLADIVGTGSSASILEITASMESEDPVTTATTGNSGMRARLESNRIDENLQNQFVFGMSFMYDGGGDEMQESPIQMGYLHQSFIGHEASLCNVVDGWRTGTDADGNADLGTAAGVAGAGWYHTSGTIKCRGEDVAANRFLLYQDANAGIELTDTDENSGSGDGWGDTRYYVALDVTVGSGASMILHPPGHANNATNGTIGGYTTQETFQTIDTSGNYLFEATAPTSTGDATTVFCAEFVDGTSGTADVTINSAQVYRYHPYEMSATNALDMRAWEGIPRLFSSFNMNNSSQFKWNERISGYKIYMKMVDSATDTLSDEWLLGLKVDFRSGNWTNYANNAIESPLNIVTDYDTTLASGHHYASIVATNIQVVNNTHSQLGKSDFSVMRNIPLETYESENHYKPDTVTCAAWKTSTIVNSKRFIGNLKINGIKYPDRMIESRPWRFDTFPNDGQHNVDVAAGDGDEIVHLESVNNKILQFKRYTTYLLSVGAEDIDLVDSWPNLGVLRPSQVTKAGNGVVWVNNNGLYYYDGDKVTNITGDKFSVDNWKIGEDDALAPTVIYDPLSNKVIIITSNILGKDNGGYIYDMNTSSIVECGNVLKWYASDYDSILGNSNRPRPDISEDELAANQNMNTAPAIMTDSRTGEPIDLSATGTAVLTSGSGNSLAEVNTFRSNVVVGQNKKIIFASNVKSTPYKAEFHTWNDEPHYLHSFSAAASKFEIKTKDIDFGNPSRRKKIYKVYVTFKAGGYMSGVIMKYATNGSDSFTNNTFISDTGYNNIKGFDSFLGSQANSTDDWITVGLKPSSSINNIYSLQLKFEWANAGHLATMAGASQPNDNVFNDEYQPTIVLTDATDDDGEYIASSVSDYYNGMPLMVYEGEGYGWDYRIIDYGHSGEPQTFPSPNNNAGGFFWADSLELNRRANIDRVYNGLYNLDDDGFPSNEIAQQMVGYESKYQLGHIPKQFEINDIVIVYREKSIK